MLKHATIAAIIGLCCAVPTRCQFATTVNDSPSTPAAPLGYINIIPQNDGGHPTVNVSHYVRFPTWQVPCLASSELSSSVNTALSSLSGSYGTILDMRGCNTSYTWTNTVTISNPGTVLLLPCATITASATVFIAAGVRNTAIRGCSFQGGSAANGQQGGTVWEFTGNGAAFEIGDPTLATDTSGFAISDMQINTSAATTYSIGLKFLRTQEIDVERVYLIGDNSTDMIAMYMDGTGNYVGGSFISNHITGFGVGLQMQGNSTGAGNASTFVRQHIDCPTSSGSPITGTVGINLAYGDGNTFIGGDVESCDELLNLGTGATDNGFYNVRNENSNYQVVAVSGSAYNSWVGAGTLFTGKVIDAGTHNTIWDAFHRESNNLNGDLWRSQADSTVTDHIQTGIGLGNVRGRQTEYTTDVPGTAGSYQNAWLWGPGDGTTGQQNWVLQDLLNNTLRLQFQQYTTAGGQNSTSLSGAGTGNVSLQCSSNAGTGGTVFCGGGATPSAVANFDSSGDLSMNGNLEFFVSSTQEWAWNCASTTVCALRNAAATTPANVFRAFPNAGTEIDSQGTSAVTFNNTSTAGTGGIVGYLGGADYNVQAFSVSGYNGSNANVNFNIGSASGYGNLALGNHLNQIATTDFAGTCAMSSSTSCTVSLQHSYTSGLCHCEEVGTAPVASSCAMSSNVATCTAASSNSNTYSIITFGNPN